MQIGLTVPDNIRDADKARAFDAALEASTRAHEALAHAGRLPDLRDAIDAGLRWRPEPPGQERFDLAPVVVGRGWGDCDDLAPWWAAQLRHTGQDRRARARVRRTGEKTWHAEVVRGDGSVDDPSVAAGMRGRGGIRAMSGPTARALMISGKPGRGVMACVQGPCEGGGAIVGIARHDDDYYRAAGRAHLPHRLIDGIGFLPALSAALPLATSALPLATGAAGGVLDMAKGVVSKFAGGGGGGASPPPGASPQIVSPPGGGGGYGWGPVIVRF